MKRQRLRSITIQGYISIRDAEISLGDINVLVGANGSGKSNFISALEMLGRMADGELSEFVGQAGGASSLLHRSQEGDSQSLRFQLSSDAGHYHVLLSSSSKDTFFFSHEFLLPPELDPKQASIADVAALGHGGYWETRLPEAAREHGDSSNASYFLELLRNCRVYHFHDTSSNAPVKQTGYAADDITLRSDAGNLAAVLLRLREDEPVGYRRIVRDIRRVAPFFREFVLRERHERVQLLWLQEGSDVVFPASALSDGTLRFICLTVLLNLPERPHLVVLDEPELGLHPYALVQLAEMLRAASRDGQILIATQSVTLMNQFALEDLIVAERKDGASVFDRPDPQRLGEWLEEYSLGELWEKNLFGGRPQPERG